MFSQSLIQRAKAHLDEITAHVRNHSLGPLDGVTKSALVGRGAVHIENLLDLVDTTSQHNKLLMEEVKSLSSGSDILKAQVDAVVSAGFWKLIGWAFLKLFGRALPL